MFLLLFAVCSVALAQDPPPGDPPPDDPPPGPQADLSVLKTGPSEAAVDSDVTYTVTVHNFGPDPALAVTVTDRFDGMSFVSATPPAGFTCTEDEELPILTCTGAALAPGATIAFTFTFHIPDEASPGDVFVNQATASTQTNDPNSENNSSSVPTTVPEEDADVAVTKSGPSSAGPDTDVTYSITVSNLGPDAATNVTLTDTLPDAMTFVSLDESTPFECTTPAVGAGGTITCTAPTLAAGTIATFTLTGHIPAGTGAGDEFENEAAVSADNNVNEENDVSTSSLIVAAVDVSVAKTTAATAVPAGSNVSYTITVANEGPDPANDVVLTDAYPAGTTFVSLTHTSGVAASSCSTGGSLSCTFNVLGNGQTSTYTLVLRAGDTTSISNTANVTTSTFDNDLTNNSSTAPTVIVTPSADLSVTKSGPATATAGTNATYVVTLTNNGASTAANVSLVDTLPANTTFISLTQSGPAFTCTPAVTSVTCTRATLAPLAATTFNITVAISPAASGTITNTAVASTATADPNGGNNTATASTTVTSSADLAVAKSGPAAATAGTNVTYTVTLTNLGPSTAANVSLVDTFPAGVTYVSSSQTTGAPFTCVPAATTLTCTRATFDPGVATFDLTFAVPVNAPAGTITNSATVSSTTPDPVGTNNTATALTGIGIAPADLSITKTANAPELIAGSTAIFTLLVQNAGPGVAENVVVTDILPPGTTLHSAPGCTGTTTVTCNVGTLAAGASTSFTLTVTLPSTVGPVVNTATVTSTTPDPTPNNNAGTVTVQAVAQAPGIPTVSEWGLLLMALGLCAAMVLRSRT
ncbi:MAG TPA: IPTL-CTERM sorting domain-containing protein [Thermoanaerobaculia bacterium]|nr:IPTL-CTERM sorting domain-containing protein [Thermoanaerobaculia bacterium]